MHLYSMRTFSRSKGHATCFHLAIIKFQNILMGEGKMSLLQRFDSNSEKLYAAV